MLHTKSWTATVPYHSAAWLLFECVCRYILNCWSTWLYIMLINCWKQLALEDHATDLCNVKFNIKCSCLQISLWHVNTCTLFWCIFFSLLNNELICTMQYMTQPHEVFKVWGTCISQCCSRHQSGIMHPLCCNCESLD